MPTTTYSTVGWHTFTVPAKVTLLSVVLDGAGSTTRPGGRVTGRLAVKEGQKLLCYVGQAGKANSGATAGAGGGGGGSGGTGRGKDGGDSGGGFAAIRKDSTSGTIVAVAGGAGGNSGDGGLGGAGGGSTGGSGGRGNAGTNTTGAATGGTLTQGGNGGTSSAGTQYNGKNALDDYLVAGGAGGTASTSVVSHGGGGGGGGLHPGGGGQASANGYAPGGGGGGGSSYHNLLSGWTDVQGAGGTGNAGISISWTVPSATNQPPVTPTDIKVNGVDAQDGMLTKATTKVKITATLFDADKQKVRLVAQWSSSSTFSTFKQGAGTVWTEYDENGKPGDLEITGLAQNTHYYVRLWAQDTKWAWSSTYNSIDFWTNKAPLAPTDLEINTQTEGMTLPSLSSATFGWTHNDEDFADFQRGFSIQYRTMATSSVAAGAWTVVTKYPGTGVNLPPKDNGPPSSSHNEWVFNPATFRANTFYEWIVKTQDGNQLWGAWSAPFTFFVSGTHTPPTLLKPTHLTPVVVENPTTFTWRFIDPDTGDKQSKADLRYRAIGATKDVTTGVVDPTPQDWVTLPGAEAPGVPGATAAWTVQANTFAPEYTYEWQVRTYDLSVSMPSGWSSSFRFYAITRPGSQAGELPSGDTERPQGSLGCGTYRVFAYEQGGQRMIGEITPITKLNFTRVRDDISGCTIFTNGYSPDCGVLYASLRSWMHELVVYRDGVRVWEGPITRIGYQSDQVEIEAKDVMAYVYRRIMRAGYNDAYRLVKKGSGSTPDEYLGLLSVVRRATMLVTQALAPFDPNVLPYLTALEYPDDAQESRIVADWSRTCWEEVDDLAATAGLDYTTVGRRILLWDTHRPVGRLPEMRDGDFSESPIVTEYGMQLATFFAVTNGSGVVGWTSDQKGMIPYGPIEQLASSYSDAEGGGDEIMTPAAKAAAEAALVEQAKRNISGRWPAPLIVRIPDNSTLSPQANVGFQQLIPGVWLPLRSVSTPRKVLQWQKLDSISVEVEGGDEKVNVVLSPAPNGGNDPDADVGTED